MARLGYLYGNVTPGTVTQADDLHTFLSANLTTWTVGAIQVFNPGVSERNYFVLSHNTSDVEVLVYIPQGTSTTGPDITGGVGVAYRETCNVANTTDNSLSIAAAPQGGYVAGFVATHDPAGADFWPASSSKAITVDYWFRSQPNMTLYIMEHTDHAEFVLYCGRAVQANGVGISMIAYSAAMHTPVGSSGYKPDGLMYMGVSSTGTNVPKTPRMAMGFWDATWVTGSWTTTTTTLYPARGNLTGLTDTNQPASDGSYLTRTVPFMDAANGRYIGIYNPEFLLEVGRITTTYGTKRGPTATPMVHIWTDYFTVWSEDFDPPTVG